MLFWLQKQNNHKQVYNSTHLKDLKIMYDDFYRYEETQ